MSENFPNSTTLNDLPEAVVEHSPELNQRPIQEDAKSFIIQGVEYVADINRITRRIKKEAQKVMYKGVVFNNKGEVVNDGGTATLIENMDVSNEILARAVFNIPETVDINDLPVAVIEPLLEYVSKLDVLGLGKAKTVAV